jgi:putative ATP-binding cassette transporter
VAFLDRIETTLGPDHFASALRMFQERSIAFIHHAEADVPRDPYDAFLELADDGGWTWATRSG